MPAASAGRLGLCRCLLGLMVCAFLPACQNIPRDPEQTLNHVTGGRMRVGLVEHPPWVIRTGGEPAGAEVELVRGLAAELAATPIWVWGGEQQHLEALKRFELDLVVGGLTTDTPWKKEIGLTSPYFEERFVVGVPAGMPIIDEIKGRQVAAPPGQAVAAYLKKQGATPLMVDHLAQSGIPAAAPDWQLEQLGFTITPVELYREKHAMATPPGENGWIKRLDDYLDTRRVGMRDLLQREESPR
jgi:polar amino acid transport system substrate-binding protein